MFQRGLPALWRERLGSFPVVVGDDPAELALAADFSHGLRPEVGIEHVVADLFALMRPLGVVSGLQPAHSERDQGKKKVVHGVPLRVG